MNCIQTNVHYNIICLKLGLLIPGYEVHSYTYMFLYICFTYIQKTI